MAFTEANSMLVAELKAKIARYEYLKTEAIRKQGELRDLYTQQIAQCKTDLSHVVIVPEEAQE